MLTISKIYLDGTELDLFDPNIGEFSKNHPKSIVSWAIASDAAEQKQAWYFLKITDEKERVCFNSGKVSTSEQMAVIPFEKIPCGETFMLELRVGTSDGQVSPNEIRLFENQALKSVHGKWITSKQDRGNRVLRFGKAFTIDKKKDLMDVCIYYCGLGYHRALVNGNPVNENRILDPAHSNYHKVCYYQVDHVDPGELKSGRNVLEIEVAPGWRKNTTDFMLMATGNRDIEFYGAQILWAQVVLHYADGTDEEIVTGKDWLVADGDRISEIFNGETYEAKLNLPWSKVTKEHAVECYGPGGILRPMTLPSIQEQKVWEPLEITQPKPGMYVVDFGQNIAGVVQLDMFALSLEEGQKIVLRHSEELNEDGTIFTEPLRDAKQTDTYIAAGDERDDEEWTPRFTYHGFRYCEVTGLTEYLAPECIRAVQFYTSAKKKSHFSCGSAILNAIQQNLLRTEEDNMHSILTDCPQRDERMGWMNDATVRFEETPYNFDVSRFFPKIMEDIRNEQREEGQFTCCAPFIYGQLPADPVCSSYLMAGKQALMHCGEINAIEEFYDGFSRWEDYLLSRSPDGTVDYSYYGDWAGPCYACVTQESAENTATDGRIMSTGYSYFNCCQLADFARRLGRVEDEKKYTEKARIVKEAFLKTWYDAQTAEVGIGSMGSQAFALWLGILPKGDEEKAAKVMHDDLVAHDYKFTTGNLNTRYLMDMLAKYGYIDDAYKVLTSETYPGYGFMIQNEATTIWERFELKKNPGMNSHNHPMYGAIGSWFYQYLGGITPIEPGFNRVAIQPYFPKDLLSAHAVVDTIKGELSVRWSKRYGKLYLFVQIPFGVTADVTFVGKTETFLGGYHVLETPLDAPIEGNID